MRQSLSARVSTRRPAAASLCVACVSGRGDPAVLPHGIGSGTMTTQRYEGTNQIQRIVMARALLKR